VDIGFALPLRTGGAAGLVLESGVGAGPDGDLSSISGLNADAVDEPAVHICEFRYEQTAGPLRLRAGVIDLTADLDGNAVANSETEQFLSPGFVNNLAVEFPAGSGPGLIMAATLGAGLGFALGAAEAAAFRSSSSADTGSLPRHDPRSTLSGPLAAVASPTALPRPGRPHTATAYLSVGGLQMRAGERSLPWSRVARGRVALGHIAQGQDAKGGDAEGTDVQDRKPGRTEPDRSETRSTESGHCRKSLLAGARILSALLLAGGLGTAQAVNLSGEIHGLLPAGLYRVTGDLVVPAGLSLTLAPGVILEFEDDFWSDYELDARGALFAEGTVQAPVIFRPAPGVAEFNYLRLADGTSRLRHCRIERAGRVSGLDEGGLWIDDCSPLVEDCCVVEGRWCGIFVTGPRARPNLTRTRVSGCADTGIAADFTAGLRLENCISTDHGGNGISLAGGPNALIGCLVADNEADGVDGGGADDFGATLVNCTVAGNCGEDLSDALHFALYNCLVTSHPATWGAAEHTYAIPDERFLGFVDPGAGDYRLTAAAPGRDAGTRFGIPAPLLPTADLDGNPRINGIVDLGAYESTLAPDTGESGPFFSPALLRPRMTQPEIRIPGTAFPVLVAALGSYPCSAVTVELLVDGCSPFPLMVGSIVARDLVPGSDLTVQLYPVGIERVQEITVGVPPGAPEGLHGIRVRLGGRVYESPQALRIHATWPQRWGLLHVTDTHVGADNEAHTAAERLRVLVREANFLQPELVVVTGDLCENANPQNAAWVDSLLTILRGLKVPVFALPGNHERYNEGGTYNPLGYFRHFHAVNRFANAELAVGGARIYGLDSGPELGALELARCLGPTTPALDWVESRLAQLDAQADRPRFLLTHGPNYDYFSWNGQNTGRVRDIAAAYGIALCLAGHTHRFETYRNEGTNWLGRNDYADGDDWGEDVALPGFPLHLQTSSLGKEQHLPMPVVASPDTLPGTTLWNASPRNTSANRLPGTTAGNALPRNTAGNALPQNTAGNALPRNAAANALPTVATGAVLPAGAGRDQPPAPPGESQRGILGDDIGFRWIEVEGTEVSFFSADTDGDGWRSTEYAWLLGELVFNVSTEPNGTITSRATNHHHETWQRPHHFIPALAGVPYFVSGGVFVHRYADGTIEAEVESIGPGAVSVVTLIPNHPSAVTGVGGKGDELHVLGNPFTGSVRFRVRLRPPLGAGSTQHGLVTLFDPAGRCIRRLPRPRETECTRDDRDGRLAEGPGGGSTTWELTWDGRDEMGRGAPPGIYFARVEGNRGALTARVVKLR
jgi:predicted MPP superfamily phosphohydrolase